MSMPQSPSGQGTAGGTDIITALQGIIRQLSAGNADALLLIAAIKAVNFPQNVKGYVVAGLPVGSAIGTLAYVTDGAASQAWGASVVGGGSTPYLTWRNGSAWTIVGK